MKKFKNLKAVLVLTLLIGSLSTLFGCGGGGGSSATTPGGDGVTTSSNGMVSGTAVKGPISEGIVTAYAITNGTMGMQLASGTTDSQGNFNISIGNYTGPLMLQMSGGTYIDEATGATVTMAPGDVMTAVMTSLSTGTTISGIQITPLTSMAQAMANNMWGGLRDANIAAANTAIGNYFMVNDILHTQPMNPLVSGSSVTATQDMRNYGMSIAAMTQYAQNIGMTNSSGIVTSMMNDASDGVLNGMMGNTQIAWGWMGGGMMGGGAMMQPTAGTIGLSSALTQFMGSAMNRSGLTLSDMQTLINHCGSSNGWLYGPGGIVTGGTGTGGIVTGGTGTGGMMSGLIGGTAFNGPVAGGTVMAFAINNGMMGAQLASGVTDTHGNFTMSLGNYSGPIMLQIYGGLYTDLATGTIMSMNWVNDMTAIIPAITTGATITGIQITPLTSMAQIRAQNLTGGMIDANITAANTAVGNYFMVSDILHAQPMNPLVSGSGTGATIDMRNYGITIAAMSQYAKTIGMTNSSGIITAMMSDASDGILNGMMGSTAITIGGGMMGGGMMGGGGTMMQTTAGTSGLATAITTFMGSTANKSGFSATDMQTLIDHLNVSNGTIQ
jgi:hypothetical protein